MNSEQERGRTSQENDETIRELYLEALVEMKNKITPYVRGVAGFLVLVHATSLVVLAPVVGLSIASNIYGLDLSYTHEWVLAIGLEFLWIVFVIIPLAYTLSARGFDVEYWAERALFGKSVADEQKQWRANHE